MRRDLRSADTTGLPADWARDAKGREPQKAQKTQKGLAREMDRPPAPFPFCDPLCFLWLLLCSDWARDEPAPITWTLR
jgi:hypothetical protein